MKPVLVIVMICIQGGRGGGKGEGVESRTCCSFTSLMSSEGGRIGRKEGGGQNMPSMSRKWGEGGGEKGEGGPISIQRLVQSRPNSGCTICILN